MSNRHLFGAITILALFLAGCASKIVIPSWVNNPEIDAAYYHAVVSVSKYDSRYKEQAFEQAVQNISMQINVSVDASVSTKEIEAFGLSYSDFSSNIQTSSRSQLKNVELFKSEENLHGYWAHYRLNKQEYRLQRLQQAQLGKHLALDLINKYDESLSGKRFDFLKSSSYIVKALDELSDLVDMDLSASIYGKEVNLYSEAMHRLSSLAANTKLSLNPEHLSAVTGVQQDLKSTVSCRYEGDSSLNLIGLKLNAYFQKGIGILGTKLISNPLGEAVLEIQSLDSNDKHQSIIIEVDKTELLEQSDNPLVKKMILGLNFGKISLELNVRNPRIWVDYSFNEESSKNQRLIDDRLRELFMEVTDSRDDADYILKVELKSRLGGFISYLNIYSAFCDAHISLSNAQTQAVLSSESIQGIKATAPNKEQAELATEPMALRAINQEIIYRLVRSYIQP